MRTIFFLIFTVLSATIYAQQQNSRLQLLGTRSWIRLGWDDVPGVEAYNIYWSANDERPQQPDTVIKAGIGKFYIQNLTPETSYKVWLEPVAAGVVKNILTATVRTQKNWVADSLELQELQTNPSSAAVPEGMQLFWQDEFNDALLNRNKWTTNYFSTFNYMDEASRNEMLEDKLPQPAYILNGKTINLFVNDSLPYRLYNVKGNQKISSIQTYDWRTNENLLNNSRGGYFEVKVKRSKTGSPKGLNTAFWFDSPGPDLKYYLQQGSTVNGVAGIRPPGQVFEIDVFELLNAQFVLHGQVDKDGKFVHNLATHITEGVQHENNWVTHGILWTPTAIKHYINGKLMGEYTDRHKIYSPDHFMSVFLGSYGSDGGVNMEVDYIRYYQWPLNGGNELPNPGFEDGDSLLPWEGDGTRVQHAGNNNTAGVLLKPGQKIEQYVYLNNDTDYKLSYWHYGNGRLNVSIDNVEAVTGTLTSLNKQAPACKNNFTEDSINFHSGKAFGNNMKTIRIHISNEGYSDVILDDITIKKP
ncbi:hypothetical protein [Parafilimonas sp.]|uniref:glycoside hydrolase family 16 protein n=1 Tax=Parafilimonas sp. TaxID=1969739 RepID=UPI0039E61459